MLNNIYLGKYYPAKSFLHSINSATKTISILLLLFGVLFVNNIWLMLPFILLAILIIVYSGVPPKLYFKSIWKLKILILLVVIFNLLIYGNNFYPSILLIFKFIMIVVYTSGLTFTTSPNEITYGLEKTFGFLRVFKVPVSDLALTLTLSLRFIPMILESASKILKSQASRGIDFKYSKLNGKIKALSSMLTPMFILSFRRADDLGNAMDLKLYNYSEKRTNYRMNEWKSIDTIILLVNVLIVTGVIVSEIAYL